MSTAIQLLKINYPVKLTTHTFDSPGSTLNDFAVLQRCPNKASERLPENCEIKILPYLDCYRLPENFGERARLVAWAVDKTIEPMLSLLYDSMHCIGSLLIAYNIYRPS